VVIVGSVVLILVAAGLLVGGVLNGSNPLIVGSMAATVIAAIVLVVGVRQSADEDDADGLAGDNTPTQVFWSPFRETGRQRRQGRWDRFRRGAAEPATGAVSGSEPTQAAEAVAVAEPVPRGSIPEQAGASERSAAGERGQVGEHGHAGEHGQGVRRSEHSATSDVATDTETEPTTHRVSDEPGAVAADDQFDDEFDDEIPPDEPAAEAVSLDDAARAAELSREVLVIDGRPRYHLPHCLHLLGRESEPLPISEAIELGFTPCALCEPDMNLLAEASQA
jgi:hypothetical protein